MERFFNTFGKHVAAYYISAASLLPINLTHTSVVFAIAEFKIYIVWIAELVSTTWWT